MADRRRIRRLCQVLDDAIRQSNDTGPDWLPAHVWERLADLLHAHMRAEEEVWYLPMFRRHPEADECRREMIADHDNIREAMRETFVYRADSADWWRAVRSVVAIGIAHLDREENDAVAESMLRLTMTRRRELGRR